jgi:hypothetical protein
MGGFQQAPGGIELHPAEMVQRPAELVVDAVTWLAAGLAAARPVDPTMATRVACAVPEPAVVALGARLRAAGAPIWLPGALAAPDGGCGAVARGVALSLGEGVAELAPLPLRRLVRAVCRRRRPHERHARRHRSPRRRPAPPAQAWWTRCSGGAP